jgi:predicted nucleic acid-binding protein
MMKILLDADASIKLTKISIIVSFATGFHVILTREVYAEQVTAGLNRDLPDAKRMEELVSGGIITVVISSDSSDAYENPRLGAGEKSVINHYLANDIDLIVSDDEAFLKVLDAKEIPFIPVAGVILMCMKRGIITRDQSFKYLEMLSPMIRDENMYYIKSKIEGF